MAFFEAFGALCGPPGIPMLDGMQNKKGLFGKRGDAEVRACAAIALGRIGTDDAFAALRSASSDKDILVRQAESKPSRSIGITIDGVCRLRCRRSAVPRTAPA